MASFQSSLDAVSEQLSRCPVCMQRYREPKQLPCYHIICMDCLKHIIDRNRHAYVLRCPECGEKFRVPEEGVEALPTHFGAVMLTKSMQFQKSVEQMKENVELFVNAFSMIRDAFTSKNDETTAFSDLFTLEEKLKRPEYPLIKEDENSPIYIEGMNNNAWVTQCITGNGVGRIVITGRAPNDCHHITVINLKGKVLRQEKIKGSTHEMLGIFLSDSKIATGCRNEIRVYDVNYGSPKMKNMRDVISTWPADRFINGVATDSAKSNILIDCWGQREVHVCDYELNYRYTLTMPWLKKYRHDMVVICGNLVICDSTYTNVCMISIDEQECTLKQELPKPEELYEVSNKSNLKFFQGDPISVCGDKNGFIYVLWVGPHAYNHLPKKCFLTQYSRDGGKILLTRGVDVSARCITTVVTGNTEKLLIATKESGRVYILNLTF